MTLEEHTRAWCRSHGMGEEATDAYVAHILSAYADDDSAWSHGSAFRRWAESCGRDVWSGERLRGDLEEFADA